MKILTEWLARRREAKRIRKLEKLAEEITSLNAEIAHRQRITRAPFAWHEETCRKMGRVARLLARAELLKQTRK